jgi:FkbM family methyltransferase
MADDRRGFLRRNLGGAAAFLAGLGAGAGGMHLHKEARRFRPGEVKHSYAQQGEDLILWNIASQFLRFHPITYLDVGAHDPVAGNNTYLFYEKGYRGVLVEPNPALWETLTATRPGDILLRAGIGAGGNSEADYYVISGDGALNTFSKEMSESYPARTNGRYTLQKVIRLPLLDLNEVMLKHWGGPPHVLSVDAEGYELAILKSLDFGRFRPNVVCVDTLEFATRRQRPEALELMAAKGYDLRGATFVNSIFVDRRHTR